MLGGKNKKIPAHRPECLLTSWDGADGVQTPSAILGPSWKLPGVQGSQSKQARAALFVGKSSLCRSELFLLTSLLLWGEHPAPPHALKSDEQLTLLTACYFSMCSSCLTGGLFFCFFQVKPCVSHWLWLHSPFWALLTRTHLQDWDN